VLELTHGDDGTLRLRGELDADGAGLLHEAVRMRDDNIVLDASELAHIDGAGLTALVITRLDCRRRSCSLVVMDLPEKATQHLRARHVIASVFSPPDVPAPIAPRPLAPQRPAGGDAPPRGRTRRRFRINRRVP
jgi:anti-anti-sigma factor